MTRRFTIYGLALATILALLTSCDLTEGEVAQVAQTVESLSPSALAGLAATVEALPQEQKDALEAAAASSGLPTLSPDEVNSVKATVDAARATATAVGQAAEQGERVNATQAPQQAPIIIYYFASAASAASMENGVRYHLNWTTENANRVEIFGNVMANPAEGSWPVYNDSNDWTLWAANDQVWVEQFMQVQPDQDTGASLQDITVGSEQVTLSFRDPQFVDGDVVNVDVNGVRVIDRYVTQGRTVSFPVSLNSGSNSIAINTQSEGVTPPMVTEVTVSNVTGGPATQVTRGMANGETQSFNIVAP